MELLMLCLLVMAVLLLVFLVYRQATARQQDLTGPLMQLREELSRQEAALRSETQQTMQSSMASLSQSLQTSVTSLGSMLTASQQAAAAAQTEKLDAIDRQVMEKQAAMNDAVSQQIHLLEARLRTLEQTNENRLDSMRRTLTDALQTMRQENTKKLEEIRGTVDEKLQSTLQKRISESFQAVSQQLEQVYKGLGEMQTLASDVGGLKKVLSGVKTRGILGEIQLGSILEEILSPEQYDTNVATIPGSTQRVEFAVRLPGLEDRPVYLPIDSKFPGDTYMHLQDAQSRGDPVEIEAAYKALESVLKSAAKDIRDKYVEPPYTTTFGILFLPFEGLYAEVVNRGLLETLQRSFQINVAGPSTTAALLNSLQMGFRTLAIQQRSSEVWEVLGAVKTEFSKFTEVMERMQGHLSQTGKDLDQLLGTRTRAINRKLKTIGELEGEKSAALLELEEDQP